jgi:outer membrane protein OmpA-like peptidoglycan-associated protein/tetratricopeptide (TPR) repeat protein
MAHILPYIRKNITMKTFFTSLCIILLSLAGLCQGEKYTRKAEKATGHTEYQKALEYFNKALEENPDSYRANAGKAILLSEFMERYQEAIPFLEKTVQLRPDDVLPMITYNLGKSYHFMGEYQKALGHYEQLTSYTQVGNDDFHDRLMKRIADCRFAMSNNAVASNIKIQNLGDAVNTSFPEYAPVFSLNNELIFTSKRKDHPKEKINQVDGKYFESMYVSRYEDGNYTPPRRFTQPDLRQRSKFSKFNESSVSMSPDGKTMYLYRNGDIYEAKLHDSVHEAQKMDKNINFGRYQNHLCMAPDGQSLYFSAESKTGYGGTDIFMCTKDANGQWSTAKLLDSTINTVFDEDAPYISDDGTLYFASNGHPGYGSYDIYKSTKVNNKWSHPENLGQPVNSPGADIFYTIIDKDKAYFSSARAGGKGDMDIYTASVISAEEPQCPTPEPMLAIIARDLGAQQYALSMEAPENISSKAITYIWKINDQVLAENKSSVQHQFPQPGSYKISAKLIYNCDTCPGQKAICNDYNLEISQPLASGNPGNKNDQNAPNSGNQKNTDMFLTQEQLKNLNWEYSPLYFEYAKAELRDDAKKQLDRNIVVLKQNKDLMLTISGYADSRGDKNYNHRLSAQRANIVKQYLLKNGVNSRQVRHVEGCGETGIVNNCIDGVECTEEQHQLNRRVEVQVLNAEYQPKTVASSTLK